MIDGRAAPVKMNGPRQTDVQRFQLSADGKWVVYLDGFNMPHSLYSQPIEGVGPIALNGAITVYTNLAVSRDSRQVVFRGKSGSAYSLYSVPIDGSRPPVDLSGSIGDIGAGFPYACKISPDSRRVVFQIGENNALWSRPIGRGGEPVMLCSATYIRYFAVSPDGKRAVYLARSGGDGVPTYHLCSRSLDGSDAPAELYSPSRRGEFVYVDFQISPDSRRVVFRVPQDVRTGLYGLYSRPIDGNGSLARLSDSPKTEGNLYAFDITPDSRQVIYLAGPSKLTRQVHARPIDGSGKSVRISEPLGEGGGVCNFQISPDGRRILYLAYRNTKALRENDSNEGPGIHWPFRDTPYKASTY